MIQRPSLMTLTCLVFGKRDKNKIKCMTANARKFKVVYFCAIHCDWYLRYFRDFTMTKLQYIDIIVLSNHLGAILCWYNCWGKKIQ